MVVPDASVRDVIIVPVALDDDIGRAQIRRDRIADTSEVDRTRPPNLAVCRLMGMTAAHDIGISFGDQRFEFVVRKIRGNARTVV